MQGVDDIRLPPDALRRVGNRAVSVMTSGLILWAFLVLIPTIHLGLYRLYEVFDILLALLPLGFLMAGAFTDRPLLSIVAFPVANLPLLVRFDELTGPRVYGLGAFVALAAASVAHLLVTLAPPSGTRSVGRGGGTRATRLLMTHTVAFGIIGLVPLLALHFDREIGVLIDAAYGAHADRARVGLTLLFLLAWLIAFRRYLMRDLTRVILNRNARLSQWYRFRTQATATNQRWNALLWAILVAGVAGIMLAAVMSQS